MNMGDIIKKKRVEIGLTQEELAEKLGLQKSAIAKYENGRVENIKRSVLKKMSELFDCSPSYLMGLTDPTRIPVYGRVNAGIPAEAIENIIDWEDIPSNWDGEYAALKVKGDSMSPRIQEGDVLICQLTSDADSGDIVVALINGQDATVKKLIKKADGIVLQPLNPAYEPLFFSLEEQSTTPVVIWGKVVENRQKF